MESDILQNRNGDKNNLYFALASGQRQENHGYDLETVKSDAKALVNVINKHLFFSNIIIIFYLVCFILGL
jgi:hypothetical protein